MQEEKNYHVFFHAIPLHREDLLELMVIMIYINLKILFLMIFFLYIKCLITPC